MRVAPLSFVAALAALADLALADVKFTSPPAGTKLTGGSAISISWIDSQVDPPLSDLSTYSIYVVAGGNDDASQFIAATGPSQASFTTTGNTAQIVVPATAGGATTNAYFIKIVSVDVNGGTVTNYSPRFTLTGMTGAFPQNVIQGLQTVTGTNGPPTQNNVGDAASNNGATGAFALAWSMQTGLTKYASMQPYPPTKITKKTKTPLFPTSPYTIATTIMAPPTILTTATLPVTWSFSQMENPVRRSRGLWSRCNTNSRFQVAPAPMPSDDMQKFLNRWKD
jgi:Ser-Thr-rich glycosyl-phosphatidyl-inositol-anchored membrane family/Yeast cell wall synthesis protein KRE9/KNH1